MVTWYLVYPGYYQEPPQRISGTVRAIKLKQTLPYLKHTAYSEGF